MWRCLLLLLFLATLGSSDHQYMVATGPQRLTRTTNEGQENTHMKPIIRSLHITSDIKYRYATTVVSTRVSNPQNQPGEATFSVTLPEFAFISEFLMDIDDTVYKAYVKGKDEAKSIYQDAVNTGRFAGHAVLNARDSNQFTVSVNIEAHGKVTFNLTYEQLLSRSIGLYNNVININTQQVVDDMSVIVNIEEPTAIVSLEEESNLEVSNDSSAKKRNRYAKIEEKSSNHKRVIWTLTPEEQRSINKFGLSGQFIVKYDIDREESSQQILVSDGYFVHFFAPEDIPKLPMYVVFVLDFSSSMRGTKLKQLKKAMDQILSDLSSEDYFSIVVFQSWIEVWSPSSLYTSGMTSRRGRLRVWKKGKLDMKFVVKATPDNIHLARSFMKKYSELRSTNIMGGLKTGLELINIGGKQWENAENPPQPLLILLTDGQPNVEESNTDVIISKTKTLNNKETPIYTLAFGYDADFNFLRKLSLQNFGFTRLIYEAADATQQLKNFYQTISSPLLSDVTFTYIPEKVDMKYHTKQEFPVFFKGSELVVAGKINTENLAEDTPLGTIVGVTATGTKTYPITKHLTLQKQQNRLIGHMEKVWSYLTVQQLLDKTFSLDYGEDKDHSRKEALDLALQYGFVTPLTSLVVVKSDGTETSVNPTIVKPGNAFVVYPTDPPDTLEEDYIDIRFDFQQPDTQTARNKSDIRFGVEDSQQPDTQTARNNSDIRFDSQQPDTQTARNNSGPQETVILISSEEHDNVTLFEQEAQIASPYKVSLESVLWLQEALNSTKSIKKVTVDGHEYKLGTNKVNTGFGCKVNNESGECHHLQYCALDVFQGNITEFLPYKCYIPGNFLGVCCPDYLI